ncbi:Virus attachment protein p12 family protein [Catalinimonas alkaloidigena]|uniref:Virus attachment protein p12 family protein n=1 Tax=Catalinimonas alkaloidigena TaxID=1075417 RepID=A0A1G9EXT0_9BACT|nr:FeoB-associated Cys-rich membrane protein [Catalinimonas alkaloidigena]SDK80893.1 Virus attachment protein p12 family protein [Catalinimonas alkaloidigena]
MWQYAIIALLFLAAAFYLGRMFWRSFLKRDASAGCGGGCAKCQAAAKFNDIPLPQSNTR